MNKIVVRLSNALARNPEVRLAQPVSLEIESVEQVAIVGPNGSGKSLLVDMITSATPLLSGTVEYDFSPSEWKETYKNIKYITFRDSYGSSDTNSYYQQRWNMTEIDDFPKVEDLLGDYEVNEMQQKIFALFNIDSMMDKRVISLSSGEMRKFQLTKILLSRPRVLIIDNPFIGLDASTRNQLNELLSNLVHTTNLQIVMVLSMLDYIPDCITNVVQVNNFVVGKKISRNVYLDYYAKSKDADCSQAKEQLRNIENKILAIPYSNDDFSEDEIIHLNRVNIVYHNHPILKNLDWTVRRGEKWALCGANGSGKSTLLSLVCADNPQSYACDIRLFGRKRGTGESIWEIKKHIGYVSPEMHRAYMKNLPSINVVASGLHDSVGLYVQPKLEQMDVCELWMDIFGICKFKDTPFLKLSSGEQRLVLLARAFVKDPELLILDEPLHGLDTCNRRLVKNVISAFCKRRNKTMVMVTHYAEELPEVIDHTLRLIKA